jgi:hypothetical protein
VSNLNIISDQTTNSSNFEGGNNDNSATLKKQKNPMHDLRSLIDNEDLKLINIQSNRKKSLAQPTGSGLILPKNIKS